MCLFVSDIHNLKMTQYERVTVKILLLAKLVNSIRLSIL